MRSLEIRNQRIFNNLIKQNQKLDSDSALKQLTTVSSVKSSASKVQHPVSRLQRPESSIQSPATRVQNSKSTVQRPGSIVMSPVSRVQCPETSVQNLRPQSKNSGMPKKVDKIVNQSVQMDNGQPVNGPLYSGRLNWFLFTL